MRADERVRGMRVHVTRSGGMAGLVLEGDLDTATLDAKQRDDVERILGQLQATGRSGRPLGADRFQYDVTIATDAEVRRVTLAEPDASTELHELLSAIAHHRVTLG
jgi:hypothetical protein